MELLREIILFEIRRKGNVEKLQVKWEYLNESNKEYTVLRARISLVAEKFSGEGVVYLISSKKIFIFK